MVNAVAACYPATMRPSAPAATLAVAMIVAGPGRALEEVTSFGDNPGDLRMFEHVPDRPGPLPLLVVLHGCGQDERFAAEAGFVALADERGAALLVPAQRTGNNGLRCFNWFNPHDTNGSSGEAGSIGAMVASMTERHGIDPARVFVVGFSAGASMAAALLARAPQTYAAGAVFAGVPVGCATQAQEAFVCMSAGKTHTQAEWTSFIVEAAHPADAWPRLLVVQGMADTTVVAANAEALALQWTGVHGLPAVPTEVVEDGARQVERFTRGDARLVEVVRWRAMGHAVPVEREPGCGVAGAFFVEVGRCGARDAFDFLGVPSVLGEPEPAHGGHDAGGGSDASDPAGEDSDPAAEDSDPAGEEADTQAPRSMGCVGVLGPDAEARSATSAAPAVALAAAWPLFVLSRGARRRR